MKENHKRQHKQVVRIFLSLITFGLSMIILPHYQGGDQLFYRETYSLLSDLDFIKGYKVYFLNLGATEPIYYLIIWISSHIGIDKDIFIAIANSILTYVALGLLIRRNVSLLISAIVVLTNYYFWVMYTGAERLKFGFIFLIISLYSIKNLKRFSTIAVLSHFQTTLIYIPMLFSYVVKSIMPIISSKKVRTGSMIISILTLIFLLVFVVIFYSQILSKVQYYFINGESHLYKIFLFMLLTIIYAGKKQNIENVVLLFIPLIILTFIVGDERVNMMGYFIFLYYAVQVNKGINMGVLVSSLYFIVKTYFFMDNILVHGDGFYGI